MALSIDRLRNWLLVAATLLVLVIGGFLGYARYRTHRFLAGLPGKLGIDIRRETDGYTYSQSVKGKTVMTLHAAKAVEHQNGKLTLHNVGMILYGRKEDRADRISGSEFEYDQKSGVVKAVGEVHIDLQAPSGVGSHAKDGKSQPVTNPASHGVAEVDEEGRVIHVKTSGLVYLQKLGIAATDQDLEFKFGGLTGHATGAEYNSDTGVLILQSAVKANGLEHDRPVLLTASHAELERENQRALLTQARYVTPGQTVRGDHAILHTRHDGSVERIEAEGNVSLESPMAGTVTAPHADVLMNATSQAQSAHLFGGVHYAEESSLREGKGQAQDARLAFDPAGRPEKLLLTGAVHVNERTRTSEAVTSPWSVRDSAAGAMTFAFANDSTGRHKELREMEATSAARMTITSDVGTSTAATTELSGDSLRGHFSGAGKGLQLSDVHGQGHTTLRRVNAQEAEQTSSGDVLDVTLRPASGHKHTELQGHQNGGEEIEKAVQAGHVLLTSRPAPKPGDPTPAITRATAELAVYDGEADHLTLTGHAQIVDDSSTVVADRIVMEHESGDASATGGVKANYIQANSSEPVHILADHADLKRAAGRAFFYGATSGRPARMWQGASQVEAPVLELDQQQRSLTAHGDRGVEKAGAPAAVHAVLVSGGSAKAGAAGKPSVVRVASQRMVYLDQTREVDFTGGVKVEDADGVMTARQAVAYLQPAATAPAAKDSAPKKAASPGIFSAGGVDRIVASGMIELEQPGRHATGEQLTYTAGDGMFVLTGTPGALPKLIDEVQGTVTGTALRFHTGDDSVMVTGDAKTPGQRVHTVTRVKQK